MTSHFAVGRPAGEPNARCSTAAIPHPNTNAANTPSKLLLLGGIEVGQNTLLRFYVLHVMAFPLIAAIFLAVHFWRIRKDGGISGPL